ncbi:hypothetical protein [Actinoplanes italicus]|uniref:hypothetical protein n=1 Tax=Actinoplanes italicus TaxID=113567 RepID=UPI0011B25C25|nr:hypothetical protein [Actinoplanes italicus]
MARIAAVAAVAVSGLAVSAGPAAADASGCTPAAFGMVCGSVYGSGRYVSDAGVARDKVTPEAICDYQGVLTVYNSGGTRIYQERSPRHGGCNYGRAWFDFYPNRYFPNNSKLSLSFYERGVHQGTTSFRIYQ